MVFLAVPTQKTNLIEGLLAKAKPRNLPNSRSKQVRILVKLHYLQTWDKTEFERDEMSRFAIFDRFRDLKGKNLKVSNYQNHPLL